MKLLTEADSTKTCHVYHQFSQTSTPNIVIIIGSSPGSLYFVVLFS